MRKQAMETSSFQEDRLAGKLGDADRVGNVEDLPQVLASISSSNEEMKIFCASGEEDQEGEEGGKLKSKRCRTKNKKAPSPSSVHPTKRPHINSFDHRKMPTKIKSTMSPARKRELELESFYRGYNPTEGLMTAVVLGGFFAFVCLMVLYKTKCKPMWKNRKKKLTNTPATQSMNNDTNEGGGGGGGGSGNNAGGGVSGTRISNSFLDQRDDGYEFECIPLKSVFTSSGLVQGGVEDGDEEDIYFLDEFGNYVFPVSAPGTGAGASCSCPPSAEELSLVTALRRQSQASAVSNAYTVKSLPGAYLYIPLLDGRSVSLSSIRRSLSDPEIHFSPPFGHPIILTVNSENTAGGFYGPSFHAKQTFTNLPNQSHPFHHGRQHRRNPNLQQRSHSIQPDSIHMQEDFVVGLSNHHHFHQPPGVEDIDNDVISIQVIQPTPNISPTLSLKSVHNDTTSPDINISTDTSNTSLIAPTGITTPSQSPSLKKKAINKHDRRVSFSEDSIDNEADDNRPSKSISAPTHGSPSSQPNKIPFMNYLQVPGQPMSFVVPQLTVEAQIAQTSPQAKKRRATRLMKAGSFASINSDGDGDIFGSNAELRSPVGQVKARGRKHSSSCESADSTENKTGLSTPSSYGKSNFDPLSDYSEFQLDDCNSDISDMFAADGEKTPLKNQGTLSDQEGSIKSLSIDQEEVGFEPFLPEHLSMSTEDDDKTNEISEATTVVTNKKAPPYNNPEYDEIMQHHIVLREDTFEEEYDLELGHFESNEMICLSSSCSISMGSENGNDQQQVSHQITVPVTIEHPPPEMRCCPSEQADSQNASQEEAGAVFGAQALHQEVEAIPIINLARQETFHTDSGLDTEDIVPLTPSREILDGDDQVQMVLVRDIGVQVCGDSPNLNRTKKYHEINPSSMPASSSIASSSQQLSRSLSEVQSEDSEAAAKKQYGAKGSKTSTSLTAETFPTEILF